MRSSSREGGFTLIELMAALVAGLIAISAIYAVSSGSARHFHEQQRIAQTQMSLRMAMAQIRADVQRAGLFGAADSDTANPPNLRSCPRPNPAIHAVDQLEAPFSAGSKMERLAQANGDRIEFDGLRLVGNYATTGSYMITGAVSATQVRMQTTWQGFRRDFFVETAPNSGVWNLDTGTPNAFDQAFQQNRILHVRTLQGTSVFSPIASTDVGAANVLVNVSGAMPIGSPCMPGLGDGATVAPLSRIEYLVVDPSLDTSLAPLLNTSVTTAAAETALGLTQTVLIRREIDFATGNVIAGTTPGLLEYVAAVEVRLIVDTAAAGAAPNLVVEAEADADAVGTAAGVAADRVRGVVIRLGARTPGTTEQFAADQSNATGPVTRFVMNRDDTRAARVRSIEAEIFLPNLAY